METRRDLRWPLRCTLSGCDMVDLRGHHHHFVGGHLSILACQCERIDQAGTRPLITANGDPVR